jgi:phosphotriesterase-related protein
MYANCVGGLVRDADLGRVLPHEHLNIDQRFLCKEPAPADVGQRPEPAGEDIRRFPMHSPENLNMCDESTAAQEAAAIAQYGGKTIVDVTPRGLSRDPQLLLRISKATRLNVIMGTGYYTQKAHPPKLADESIVSIAGLMVREITEGVNGVKAGVIGEIGTDEPLHGEEIRVLRAAGRAHLETGCPVSIHFAGGCRELRHVLRLLSEEGLRDFSRVVICHMDVTLDLEQAQEVADCGAMIEYDTFGHEGYRDSKDNLMPSDERRVEALAELRAQGLLPHVLVSHDVCMRSLWRRFGGYGYTNLFSRIAAMLVRAGFDEADLNLLFVKNPARTFAYIS